MPKQHRLTLYLCIRFLITNLLPTPGAPRWPSPAPRCSATRGPLSCALKASRRIDVAWREVDYDRGTWFRDLSIDKWRARAVSFAVSRSIEAMFKSSKTRMGRERERERERERDIDRGIRVVDDVSRSRQLFASVSKIEGIICLLHACSIYVHVIVIESREQFAAGIGSRSAHAHRCFRYRERSVQSAYRASKYPRRPSRSTYRSSTERRSGLASKCSG